VNLADRIEAGFDRAVARARKRSGLFDHVWQALDRFADVLGGRLAAAISYYAFFAAFSLAVLAYSILGRLLGSAEAGVLSAVNDYLETQLPWVAETAKDVGRGEITLVATAALLISGVGWVESLRSSLRAVWLLDQHPGHWFLRRVVDLGMLVGLGLLLGLSLATTTAIDRLLDWLAADTGVGQVALRPFGPVLEFVVNLILAAAMLTAVPRLRLSPRRLITPTLVIAVGIQLLNTVGRSLIARSEDRPAYTAVATSVGLLIYLYLLNQLILFGAALAATATKGTAVDLGAGAAGLGAGGVVRSQPAGSTVDNPDSGTPVDNVGEPHGSGPKKPR
jgi:membrane protein